MKYAIVAALALTIIIAAHSGGTAAHAWVCGEDAPSPEATCTPVPTKTPPATQTPYVVTATFTPTPRPTKTPLATQTPVIIVVTATPDRSERRIIVPPNTGSGGYR